MKASKRKSNNTIRGLRNESPTWTDKAEVVANIIKRYYNNLFSSINPSSDVLSVVIGVISSKVSEDQNQMLTRPFTSVDVYMALRQFLPSKAPSLNDFFAFFFHRF